MYVSIKPSNRKNKKMMAIFYDENKKKIKTVHFGDSRYQDFTQHHDENRRANYINRHFKNEDWEDYMSAGALAKYILWQYTDIERSINSYLKRFGLKEY